MIKEKNLVILDSQMVRPGPVMRNRAKFKKEKKRGEERREREREREREKEQ